MKWPRQEGRIWNGKLWGTGRLLLETADILAATATTKLACNASSTPRPRTSGSHEGDGRGLGTLEPDAIRVSSRGCGGFRNLLVSGQLREPGCLPCVYLAPQRGWKSDLRGDQALVSPCPESLTEHGLSELLRRCSFIWATETRKQTEAVMPNYNWIRVAPGDGGLITRQAQGQPFRGKYSCLSAGEAEPQRGQVNCPRSHRARVGLSPDLPSSKVCAPNHLPILSLRAVFIVCLGCWKPRCSSQMLLGDLHPWCPPLYDWSWI